MDCQRSKRDRSNYDILAFSFLYLISGLENVSPCVWIIAWGGLAGASGSSPFAAIAMRFGRDGINGPTYDGTVTLNVMTGG